ncbi:hypothetical protein cand_015910 [Cryptosporidium andersoni]|uniref:Sugar phosphate transporter domain-containing protein n=1 Tax=Cryptosporidium andersoni TaxID=117008 RepID=A0A1J4MTS5_9CRYT|nr:hypothetical protein cand_015910 [Cryptosporidium andersoni]
METNERNGAIQKISSNSNSLSYSVVFEDNELRHIEDKQEAVTNSDSINRSKAYVFFSSLACKLKFWKHSKNWKMTIFSFVGYFFTSIGVVYYNYWLFENIAPFPVFVTWVQQIVGVCCFGIIGLYHWRSSPQSINIRSSPNGGVNYDSNTTTSTSCTSSETILGEKENNKKNEINLKSNSLSCDEDEKTHKIRSGDENKAQKSSKNGFFHILGEKVTRNFGMNDGYRKFLKILPMSICFVGLVAFANICLKYVQVSTYQVARSGSLIFTVIVSYIMLGQRQTWQSICACIVVCIGFLIGSLDRTTLNLLGISTGLASSFCQVFYNVFMKKCMNCVNGDALKLVKYNQCISCILLIPCIFAAQELKPISESAVFDFNSVEFFRTWFFLIVCGFISMSLNYFSFLVVGYTSPVTFNVIGMFKSCAQTAGGFIFFNDSASPHAITGIVLTFIGSVWYGFSKAIKCNFISLKSCRRCNSEDDKNNIQMSISREIFTMEQLHPINYSDNEDTKSCTINDNISNSLIASKGRFYFDGISDCTLSKVDNTKLGNGSFSSYYEDNCTKIHISDDIVHTEDNDDNYDEDSLTKMSNLDDNERQYIKDTSKFPKLLQKFPLYCNNENISLGGYRDQRKFVNSPRISSSLPSSICTSPTNSEFRHINTQYRNNGLRTISDNFSKYRDGCNLST